MESWTQLSQWYDPIEAMQAVHSNEGGARIMKMMDRFGVFYLVTCWFVFNLINFHIFN